MRTPTGTSTNVPVRYKTTMSSVCFRLRRPDRLARDYANSFEPALPLALLLAASRWLRFDSSARGCDAGFEQQPLEPEVPARPSDTAADFGQRQRFRSGRESPVFVSGKKAEKTVWQSRSCLSVNSMWVLISQRCSRRLANASNGRGKVAVVTSVETVDVRQHSRAIAQSGLTNSGKISVSFR